MVISEFFLGETTALVNQVCEEHDIDLDDESDVSPSQSSRCDFLEDDAAVDLDELIGKSFLLRKSHVAWKYLILELC